MDRKGDFEYKDKPFCIGGIFPLTGYLSWLGIYKKKAAELKIELINRSGGIGGRPLKLVTYDDCSSPERAAKAAEVLIYKHRAIALVGTGSVPISLAVARVANKNKVLAFLTSGYTIDPVKDSFVFNTAHRTEFALACAFQYFYERGISRIALLMPYGPLGDVGSWFARQLACSFGIKITIEERFDLAILDIKVQLEGIRNSKPQAVFSFVTGRPAAWVARSMANIGLEIPLLVSHGNANPRFLKMISGITLDVIVPSGKTMVIDYLNPDDPSMSRITDFNRIHMARFGEPANYYSAEQVDAIDLIALALRYTDGKTEELKDALESVKDFVGMQGVYSFSNMDHYGMRPESLVLLSIRDGKWHLEKSFSSTRSFEFLYGNRRSNLVFKIAGMLFPSLGGNCKDNEKEIYWQDLYRVDNNICTKKEDERFFKDYYQYKKDMIKALNDEDEIKARHCLYYLLLSSSDLDDDSFKEVTFETFLTLCDIAFQKGLDIAEIIKLRHLFTEEWRNIKERDRLCFLLIRSFYEIMEMILRKAGTHASDLLRRIMLYVKDNYKEELSVERVASHVCLSPSYLIHRLKKQYGITLTECIAMVRIENAKALLKSTDASVCTIAHEVGYHDQSYFTKVFKRYTGCTPKEYRRSPARKVSGASKISEKRRPLNL